jgi:hypothetical protein
VVSYEIIRLGMDGNVQLTGLFEILNGVLSGYNTKAWISEGNAGITMPEEKECEANLIVNSTEVWDESTTFIVATDWQLPTRPAGLDAIITSGMQGPRGQMVDVVVTTIKYEIKDSKGQVLTDVVLSPSKSATRSTTQKGSATSTSTPNLSGSSGSSNLSSSATAGIGAGVGVGVALILFGAGFLLLRRRKTRKAILDGKLTANKYEKPELATGPGVEIYPPIELPQDSIAFLHEVPGDAHPGLGRVPVELHVQEPVLELGTPMAVGGYAQMKRA